MTTTIRHLALLILACLLAACGGGGSGSAGTAQPPVTPEPQPTPSRYSFLADNTAIYAVDRSQSSGGKTKVFTLSAPLPDETVPLTLSVPRAEFNQNQGFENLRYDIVFSDAGKLYHLPGQSIGLPVARQISNISNMSWSCGQPDLRYMPHNDQRTRITFKLPDNNGDCDSNEYLVVHLAMTANDAPFREADAWQRHIPLLMPNGDIQGYLAADNGNLVRLDSTHANPVILKTDVSAVQQNYWQDYPSTFVQTTAPFITVTTSGARTLYRYNPTTKHLGPALGDNIELVEGRNGLIYGFASDNGNSRLVVVHADGQTPATDFGCSQRYGTTPLLSLGGTEGLMVVDDGKLFRIPSTTNLCSNTLLSQTVDYSQLFALGLNNTLFLTDTNNGLPSVRLFDFNGLNDITFANHISSAASTVGLTGPDVNIREMSRLIMADISQPDGVHFKEHNLQTGQTILLGILDPTIAGFSVSSVDFSRMEHGVLLVHAFSQDSAESAMTYQDTRLLRYESGKPNSLRLADFSMHALTWLNLDGHGLR